MKTVCVLYTAAPAVEPGRLLAGRGLGEWRDAALGAALPGVPRVVLGSAATAVELVAGLTRAAAGADEVVLVPDDAPFLRSDLLGAMLQLHRDYRADYTFADGFPGGLTGEILRADLLPRLEEPAAAHTGPVGRETVFQLLSADINRYDIETYLSPVDLRARRLSFTADSRRNWLLLDRFAAVATAPIDEFLREVEQEQGRARTLPATLHVQITDGVLQVPVWSPLRTFVPDATERRGALSRAAWNHLLDRVLAWAGDLTVLPAFWGEPSVHPQILDLLTDALAKPGLRLVIETSGLGWSGINLEALAGASLDWVVELDSDQPDTYRQMRGEGYEEAHAFVRRLLPLFPGRVWPQTVRMQLNEPEMEGFYQHWKAEAGQVIIQKHNDFGGRLPRSKPSDLSPWKRHACWHLARDLAVFLDGTTVVCRDDYDRTLPLGNLHTEDPAVVWARGEPLFGRHVKGDWPEVCRLCDEWYTFHF